MPQNTPPRVRRATALQLLISEGLSTAAARKLLSELQCRPGATWRPRPGARAYYLTSALRAAVGA